MFEPFYTQYIAVILTFAVVTEPTGGSFNVLGMHHHVATTHAAIGILLLHLETQTQEPEAFVAHDGPYSICILYNPAASAMAPQEPAPRSTNLTLTCSCCQTQARCKVQRLFLPNNGRSLHNGCQY